MQHEMYLTITLKDQSAQALDIFILSIFFYRIKQKVYTSVVYIDKYQKCTEFLLFSLKYFLRL